MAKKKTMAIFLVAMVIGAISCNSVMAQNTIMEKNFKSIILSAGLGFQCDTVERAEYVGQKYLVECRVSVAKHDRNRSGYELQLYEIQIDSGVVVGRNYDVRRLK